MNQSFFNASVFLGEIGFIKGGFTVSDGRIREIIPESAPGDFLEDIRESRCTSPEDIRESRCTSPEDSLESRCTSPEDIRESRCTSPEDIRESRNAPPENIRRSQFGSEVCRQRTAAVRPGEDGMDLEGMYVIPGLVDIHTHGNSGYDFSDADEEGLIRMGKYLAAHGITSFAPASMTLPYDRLSAAFQTAVKYAKDRPKDAARMAGIHMEGPYFSEKKKGAQNSAYLKLPDAEGFLNLQKMCGGLIQIVDVAPELEGAEEFIRKAAKVCRVSVAHTDAGYDKARCGFEAGASHLTHLFNAMPPIHHRAPGVIGAASERDDVTAELICDGLHVHPSMVRMAFRLFPGRICLISDALRCCGMPDGIYELGGQQVTLKDGQARIADGNLAGAVSDLYTDMVNAIRFGIPAEEAIKAATIVPAREVGTDRETGSLDAGKWADFLVCDGEWNLKQVYIGGMKIR